jgi:hypothetical protein
MFAAKTVRITCALFAAAAFAGGAQAATSIFNTSESASGPHNLGNWSATQGNTATNTNYAAGNSAGTVWRNFFSFNLGSLNLSNQQIVSATLQLRKYGYVGSDPSETVQFFDVSTPVQVLNNNTGMSTAIFDDLGSGTSYGSVAVSQSAPSTGTVSVSLNAAALADITAAAGGYFSIGGNCTTCALSQNVFATSSATGDQLLVIQTAPIPEPSTYAMLGIGLAALAFLRRRQSGLRVGRGSSD